jgi:hypothetical protein
MDEGVKVGVRKDVEVKLGTSVVALFVGVGSPRVAGIGVSRIDTAPLASRVIAITVGTYSVGRGVGIPAPGNPLHALNKNPARVNNAQPMR